MTDRRGTVSSNVKGRDYAVFTIEFETADEARGAAARLAHETL